jgi:2OG-Fe(II) oxygenase superfamily
MTRNVVTIRVRRSGLSLDTSGLAELRARFETSQCVRLQGLLDPDLLSFLVDRLERGTWSERVHDGIGVEHVLDEDPALHMLFFLVNAPRFRDVIEAVTGCRPLTRFNGRIYRMVPSRGHYDDWHNDVSDERLVGMSVNLSPRGYTGGTFQLRQHATHIVLAELANTGFGDAILFRISSDLEHRVTDVEGAEAKVAFAGWFRRAPTDLFSLLREPSTHRTHSSQTSGCTSIP